MDLASAIRSNERLKRLFWQGKFGLETERLRVDSKGCLAHSPHPAGLGSKSEHPFITTDFSESQLELISPPMDSLESARGFIQTLLNVVQSELPEGEQLWPQSMPCALPDEEQIPLARFDGDASGRTEYREYLSRIYGRSRQTISGSHFNFSFLPEFFELLSRETGLAEAEVKEQLYLKMVRNLMRDRWLLVGLLGRSPLAHESLHLKELVSGKLIPVCCKHGVSIRCSAIGYRNPESLPADYSSVQNYLDGLNALVSAGKLLNPNELYLPVRMKTASDGKTISHIELRIMDIDPEDPTGMPLDALRLLHLGVLFAALKDENDAFEWEQQIEADHLQNQIACWGFSEDATAFCEAQPNPGSSLRLQASELFDDIERRVFGAFPVAPAPYRQSFESYRSTLEDWNNSPVNKLKQGIETQGFIPYHLQQAGSHALELASESFKFHAFTDLELSTQLLLKAAVRKGIQFEILDRKRNFIRLNRGAKQELVIQATKTSLDRYSTILAMENKKVTKQILREHGIATPAGRDFNSPEEARSTWPLFSGHAIVVKPMNTNFGIGISILKSNTDRVLFDSAIEAAFREDQQILIENYISGREFRYFLIEDQVVAILHRVPANITGDGRLSIRALVERKNLDPLRGKGYVTPLERIALNAAEAQHLKSQGLNFDSIPAEGETVYLRENSNISTGGDSIDFSDRIHPSYARVASAAANALGVKITGLDMIIQDIDQPANADNHSVIEMNFNPAIHIHCHPFQGENRRLDERILSALGFI
ncbi:MAG: bifunctional glutamate--cysteine ligase GshA/glutathione synthetase GshB [Opitutales bacterium]|nr:bifunctional glutamate--cysteine ligase GshA/glutathione synthetase GshB [Opitutales bacterium]